MLRSTALISLAFAIAAPVFAGGPAAVATGNFEGQTFEYASRLVEGDKVEIEGKFVKDGQPFQFVVKPSGLVDGSVGSTPVTFRVSRAERNRLAEKLKARTVAQSGAAFSAGTN